MVLSHCLRNTQDPGTLTVDRRAIDFNPKMASDKKTRTLVVAHPKILKNRGENRWSIKYVLKVFKFKPSRDGGGVIEFKETLSLDLPAALENALHPRGDLPKYRLVVLRFLSNGILSIEFVGEFGQGYRPMTIPIVL